MVETRELSTFRTIHSWIGILCLTLLPLRPLPCSRERKSFQVPIEIEEAAADSPSTLLSMKPTSSARAASMSLNVKCSQVEVKVSAKIIIICNLMNRSLYT